MSIFLDGRIESDSQTLKWFGEWHFAKEKKAPQRFNYEVHTINIFLLYVIKQSVFFLSMFLTQFLEIF